jgi:hypothetical protein
MKKAGGRSRIDALLVAKKPRFSVREREGYIEPAHGHLEFVTARVTSTYDYESDIVNYLLKEGQEMKDSRGIVLMA